MTDTLGTSAALSRAGLEGHATTSAELIFRAYTGSDPSGTALGILTDAFDKTVTVELNAAGSGEFKVHSASPQAAWCKPGNYVRVWRGAVTGPAIAGFWIEEGGDVMISPDEDGGRIWHRAGRGPEAILRKAIVWHQAVSGGTGQVQPGRGRWHWPKGTHPARPLVRLLEEADARNAIQAVTWDFTRTTDSDDEDYSVEYADRWNIPIGIDLLEVVEIIREAGMVISMSPDFVLSLWEEDRVNDLSGSISFVEGVNIRESSEREVQARRAASHALVGGENVKGWMRYQVAYNSTYQTFLGERIEGYHDYQRTPTKSILRRVGARKLRRWRKQHDGPLTLGLIDTPSCVALVDYTVGDTITVDIPDYYDETTDEVVSVTLTETDNGEYDPIVQLGDLGHALNRDSRGWHRGDADAGGGGVEADNDEYLFEDWVPEGGEAIVVTGSSGDGYATSYTHTQPVPEGVLADDLGIFVLWTSGAEMPVTTPSGWTLLDDYQVVEAGPNTGWYAWTRTLDGSETTVSVSITADAGDGQTIAFSEGHIVICRGITDVAHRDFDDGGDVTWTWGGSAVLLHFGLVNEWSPALLGASFFTSTDTVASSPYTPSEAGLVIALEGTGYLLTASQLGTIPVADTTGGWWSGGNLWWPVPTPATTHLVDGETNVLRITSDVAGDDAEYLLTSVDDADATPALVDQEPLPTEISRWTMRLAFQLMGASGSLTDSGARMFGFTLVQDDQTITWKVRLGDATRDEGLLVDGATTDYAASAISLDTTYTWLIEWDDGTGRAKLWEGTGDDPAVGTWDVEAAAESTPGAADQFSIIWELGNDGGTAQVLEIGQVWYTAGAYSGDLIKKKRIPHGSDDVIDVGEAYEAGTLDVWVDGAMVVPLGYKPDLGTARLPAGVVTHDGGDHPAACSVVRVSYEKS